MTALVAFLPELLLLLSALVLFALTLGHQRTTAARAVALTTAGLAAAACVIALTQEAVLFSGAYRVDLFSQVLKLVLALGFGAVLVIGGRLADVQETNKPEYFLFLTLSVTGLMMLVSCVDIITLVVALEFSSFPLYVLVALRREGEHRRVQMESAIKYLMFGVAATGLMLFGLGYLYGLTGTTSLPLMMERLQPLLGTPLAIVGLGLACAALWYKLAIFPFHFWTPDVYQGAANETATVIASLPKLGAAAVLVRFVAMASPGHSTIAVLLTVLAVVSMFYGNLLALGQSDLKRLLGFSGIAHAGYVVVGFTSLNAAGFGASLYYLIGYVVMVLACFLVICHVSRDGRNIAIEELAGLHRRSPWLAVTLLAGLFGLAGLPPFAGFMGKLSMLTAALAEGHLTLVVITMVNAAIAIYYYLRVAREVVFSEPAAGGEPLPVSGGTKVLGVALVVVILVLGLAPAPLMDALQQAVATVHAPLG